MSKKNEIRLLYEVFSSHSHLVMPLYKSQMKRGKNYVISQPTRLV